MRILALLLALCASLAHAQVTTTPAANPQFVRPAVAFASLPTAAGCAGCEYRVTDMGPSGFGSIWASNGTRWAPITGATILAALGNQVTGVTNSETILFQTLIPAGAWQTNDTLRFYLTPTKSGTTDSASVAIRIGTAGTTADAGTVNNVALGAASLSGGFIYDLKLTSATTVVKTGGGSNAATSYAGATSSAAFAPITISSAASNALYVTVTIRSSSTNDTVGMQSGEIELRTP